MTSEQKGRAAEPNPARPRILAVDDTPANLAALEVVLSPLGYFIDGVESGGEALRRLREKEYDLVLLDMRMPTMDGLETARRMREQVYKGPILLISAYEPHPNDLVGLISLEPIDVASGLVRPELLCTKVKGWISLQTSLRTWKTLARELALENDRLRGKVQAGS